MSEVEKTPQERLETLVVDEHYERITSELQELRPHFVNDEVVFAHINAIGNIMSRLKVVATPNPPVVQDEPGSEVLPPAQWGLPEDGTEDDYTGDTSSDGGGGSGS